MVEVAPQVPVSTATGADIRVRFCPSPTGDPHVGMVRTALFNWAWARHTGGTFVFRIEDTDVARDSEESYQALLDTLTWMGMSWDEGPEVGGPHGPYRQSLRRELYDDAASRLRDAGFAYPCYCTTQELEVDRDAAKAAGRTPGYSGRCRALIASERADREHEGRPSVLRFAMPGRDLAWHDLVRGQITFAAQHVPDYVLVRANGDPLYTLVNPVDDAMMGITDVLRGEDLLASTPRQIALHEALAAVGIGTGVMPRFGHLPYVMGEGNRKLSKRDPESRFWMYVENGYLPEGLTNYLALLGWSPGDDLEFFSLAQMAAAFEVSRVQPNPARFDLKKCNAINSLWIRYLAPDDLAARLQAFLVRDKVLSEPVPTAAVELVRAGTPLVAERMETLKQGAAMLTFLFVDQVSVEPESLASVQGEGRVALTAAHAALLPVESWTAPEIEAALRAALVVGLGLKPKLAFGPVRVAVTGRRVSPPLFESMELLGREQSLARIAVLLPA